MTGRARTIITVVGILLVVLVVFFFLIRPKRAELAQVRTEIEGEEARTVQLQTELDRLKGLQARAPELEAELAVIRRLVPPNAQVSNLIFQVQDAANQAGLDFLSITPELPRQPPEGAALAQVRVSLGIKGGYFAIQDFLRRLYTLDRALRVDNFTLGGEPDETGGIVLSTVLASRVFYELPEAGAGAGTVPAAPAPAAPEAAPTPTESPAP